ncbi:hypothetical protein OUZ56_012380 [Daphnia magna]|uniref:Uncharacterized protein n=1 Tax=Daphnia magna TaxID=35525 RepID=A0ABQ9Z338_9CRUS|nr:hypothetical protein OUZ56_012380 [Daphnia magna]
MPNDIKINIRYETYEDAQNVIVPDKISIETTPSECNDMINLKTPIGTASTTAGNLSHNHLTLIWDNTYTHYTAPINRLVESCVGTLTRQTGDTKSFRLQDNNNQLDFHFNKIVRTILQHMISLDNRNYTFDRRDKREFFINKNNNDITTI